MNWPVILSGVVSLAALTLGFDLLLPLGSGLEPVMCFDRRRVRYGLFRPYGWRITECRTHQPHAHKRPPTEGGLVPRKAAT